VNDQLWANLFEICNLGELRIGYRLLRIDGLPADDQLDRNVQQLVSDLAYELRQPVARTRRDGEQFVALPSNAAMPRLRRQLVPHAVDLIPDDQTFELDLANLDDATAPIGRAFLQFAVRTPLYRDRSLWQNGRAWYQKQPRSGDGRTTVDIYDGFRVAVVMIEGRRAFVAVDLAAAYVDRLWLPQRLNGGDFGPYRGRRALYHYGPNWFIVQLAGMTGKSISEQTFVPDGGQRIDVLNYTRAQWPRDSLVASLAPDSPAVVYRSVGAGRERYGALGLCKVSYTTQNPEVAGLHRASIVDPTPRFARAAEVVRRHFARVELDGHPLQITDAPLQLARKYFAFPAQKFGNGAVLGTASAPGVTHVEPIERIGRGRMDLLLNPKVGPLDQSPFDAQYAVIPQGLPRNLAEDFLRRVENGMRSVSGQPNYKAKTVLYRDGARSLYQQLTAIGQGLSEGGIRRGYALLVLPVGAHVDLHHQVKQRHWPDIQIQCANAGKIRSYYEEVGSGTYRVRSGFDGRLNSYVRNIALGMLSANRKWPWALASQLHYDMYIGVDVLNRIAGITCVYGAGASIFFRDYRSTQPERLSAAQMRQMVIDALGTDLLQLGLRPHSVVMHRDGRSFASERRGLHAAIDKLISDGILPVDVEIGIVDVRKSSADHLRLAGGQSLGALTNPLVGSYFVLDARSGIVATTGAPFQFPGTAEPLSLEIVEGDLQIEAVLEDAYALSTLIYSAPDRCGRLPVTIRLADDLLEPIAGADPDDESALYDTEAIEGDGTDEGAQLTTAVKGEPRTGVA
jgi:hypothetical protein